MLAKNKIVKIKTPFVNDIIVIEDISKYNNDTMILKTHSFISGIDNELYIGVPYMAHAQASGEMEHIGVIGERIEKPFELSENRINGVLKLVDEFMADEIGMEDSKASTINLYADDKYMYYINMDNNKVLEIVNIESEEMTTNE